MKCNRGISLFSFILSVLAVVLMIGYFCIRTQNLESDAPMLLVAVLAILVTVLLAWQIYNVIDFENKIKGIKQELRDEFHSTVKEITDEISRVADENQDNLLVSMITFYNELLVFADQNKNNYLKLRSAIYLRLFLESKPQELTDENYAQSREQVSTILEGYKTLELEKEYIKQLYLEFTSIEQMYPNLRGIPILSKIKKYLEGMLKNNTQYNFIGETE